METPGKTHPKTSHHYARIVIAVLVVALIILGYFLYRQYSYIQHFHVIRAEQTEIADIKAHRSLTAADVSYIQSWMTFEYVSSIFNLSPEYLKTDLAITDPEYPHVSIARYARAHGADTATFTLQVQDSVRRHFIQH